MHIAVYSRQYNNKIIRRRCCQKIWLFKMAFLQKFHSYTGCSFNTYVRHYRIQLAAIDILQGKKITDVAMYGGYDSSGGFNKAFLKEYGCYPTEYKKRAKECQLNYERRKK